MPEIQGKASTKAKNKYNAKNYERISLFVEKGKKEKIKAHADNKGESLNGYINKAIDNAMNNDWEVIICPNYADFTISL